MRIALGIRAQLFLALTVFLVMPFLGYEYVRELERFLRDAQEQALAGTAQALAAALHDRPRLFDLTPLPLDSLAAERGTGTAAVARWGRRIPRRSPKSRRSSTGFRARRRASG